jgi:hypothetical protein
MLKQLLEQVVKQQYKTEKPQVKAEPKTSECYEKFQEP